MKDSRTCMMRRQSSSGLLKRIWKKVKGSHNVNRGGRRCDVKEEEQTEAEGSALSEPECGTFPESPVVNSTTPSPLYVKDVIFMPNQQDVLQVGQNDDDDGSVSSASSCSMSSCSSDGYYDMLEQEMNTVPTIERRLSERSITVENPGERPTTLKRDAPEKPLKYGWTHVLDIGFETIPEGEPSDGSDEDSTERKKKEAYVTKEDQDVAVFTDIATQLDMKSLVHLLQGQEGPQQNRPTSHLQPNNQALTVTGKQAESMPSAMKHPSTSPRKTPLAKKKHFRWAEVTDSRVRVVIHEVECVKDCKDMCWSPEELSVIKKELVDAVQFFRQRRQHYIHAIEIVARGNQGESVIEDHMKQLMADSSPRGLETHIVKMLYDHRKSAIQAVLDKQRECKSRNDPPACTARCIREQSLAYSQMNIRFSCSMARCDEIEALQAKMSRWRVAPASADEVFFSV